MNEGTPWNDTESGRDAGVAVAFGAELRSRRRAAGRTQADLAEAAGVHAVTVSLLERGRRQPSLGVSFRLSRALGLPSDGLARAVAAELDRGDAPGRHPAAAASARPRSENR